MNGPCQTHRQCPPNGCLEPGWANRHAHRLAANSERLFHAVLVHPVEGHRCPFEINLAVLGLHAGLRVRDLPDQTENLHKLHLTRFRIFLSA